MDAGETDGWAVMKVASAIFMPRKLATVFLLIAAFAALIPSAWSSVIYFNGGDPDPFSIHRIAKDGMGLETVVSAATIGALNSGRGFLRGLAVNPVSQKMYFSILDDNKLLTANLDGSNAQVLFENISLIGGGGVFSAGDGSGLDIEVDTINGNLYFQTTQGVARSGLDGSNPTLILSEQQPIFNFGLVMAIAVDPSSNVLFATGTVSNSIVRADLNGNNPQTIIQFGVNVDLEDIEVDPVNQKVYWTDKLTKKMQRANYDGSNIEDVITASGPSGAFGGRLALDVAASKAYWTGVEGDIFPVDTAGIFRVNFDGTNPEVVYLSVHSMIGLDFGPLVPLVEPSNDIPEPTTLAIFGFALVGLGVMRRRRRGAWL